MTWEEAKLFLKFLVGGIGVVTGVVSLWVMLDLPQAASKDYVDKKFALAADYGKQTQTTLVDMRLQLNNMNRRNLEAEKYRLEEQNKTNPTFDIQKRINDITQDLKDIDKERSSLQQLKFQ